jgi:hypothetical protein
VSGAPEANKDNIPEIEVTPEMIDAGEGFARETAGDLWGMMIRCEDHSPLREFVESIYRAMDAARSGSSIHPAHRSSQI